MYRKPSVPEKSVVKGRKSLMAGVVQYRYHCTTYSGVCLLATRVLSRKSLLIGEVANKAIPLYVKYLVFNYLHFKIGK